MLELNQVYEGDCIEVMKDIDDGSIDLTVTSPPYDNLRTYNNSSIWNWEIFTEIAEQLFRVTKKGGVVVWVVGDATKKFCESLNSFREALYFVDTCGFNLLDTMIYHKSNYAPAYPTLRRYANTFEYMFVFSKGRPNTFNPIQQEKVLKNYKNKKSYFRQKDGSQILKIIDCDRETKDAENVWTISPTKAKGAGDHPAVFPEQLANDHILSWSNKGDIVLDPMIGSGTTGKMAKILNRNFIGIEKDPEYCEIAKQRIKNPDYKPTKPKTNQQPGLFPQEDIQKWCEIK